MIDENAGYQISDDQLSPEELKQRREMEAYIKRESEYSNSYENIEKEGYGYPKTRTPSENTDFSNLKMQKYEWDFQIKNIEYDVYHIPGYPHSMDNCLYFCPKNETPSYNNLKPFDKKWSAVDWSFEIKETKSWKYKWDEIRTNSGWIGYLYRNSKIFHKVFGSTKDDVWYKLQTALMKAYDCPLNFTDRNWKEKAIGRKIWYHENPCIIKRISDYEGIELRIEGDNQEKTIDPPAIWNNDNKDDICNKERWYSNYADGCNVEWNSEHINWFRS
jgi:hypothetical protein